MTPLTEGPPDTILYLFLSLGASAVFIFGLIGSIVLRYRNIEKDRALLDEIAREG